MHGDCKTQPSPVEKPGQGSPKPCEAWHEEYQYLNLIRQILREGEYRPDRTGTGTYSIFAPAQLRFTLSRPATSTVTNSTTSDPQSASALTSPIQQPSHTLILPLLTTKRVFLRAVIAELFWFISGDTSSHTLSAQGIKIWDGNGSRAFLDSVGLSHREEGDLGPVYGFQWRHFGAEYKNAQTDYTGQGVDQLADVIRKLRHTPYDRRIILSAWNPADLGKMALPPCHMFAQFYVSFEGARRGVDGVGGQGHGMNDGSNSKGEKENKNNDKNSAASGRGTLHCLLYQRSCDIGLGVPFNIASYALLTHMLAHVCDLIPGTFTHTMGDAHVYVDHVDALREQIERKPRPFPTLEIARADARTEEEMEPGIQEGKDGRRPGEGDGPGNVSHRSIDGWRPEDFVVKGYEPHKGIAMKMSV